MAISAQELNIILTAKDKQFAKAMADNQKRVERFAAKSQKDLSKTGKSFSALGTAAKRLAPLLAAAFGARAISNMINAAAELGNLASVAGLSVERFQEVAFAAQQFGVSAEKMADILKDVNDKFGDFVQTGAGPLADFFENIAPAVGLTADAFAKLSSEEKLGKYIQALEKVNLSQADMTFYMEAIASDSTLLQGAFASNGAELDRLSTKIRDAGGVMDKEMVDKAKAAKEEFSLASEVINTQFAVALGDLTPLLTDAAYLIRQVASAIGESYQQVRRFFGEISEQDIRARIKSIDDKIAKVKEKRGGKAGAAEFLQRLYSDRSRLEAKLPNLADDESIVGLPTAPAPPGGGQKPPGGRVKASTATEREAAEKRIEMLRKGQLATLQAYADAVAEGEDAAAQMAADHVDRLRDVQAAYDSVRGSLDPVYAATQQYAEAIQEVNAALAEGFISEEQAAKDREGLLRVFETAKAEASELSGVMETVSESFATAFGDIISGTSTVEGAFRKMAGTILTELFRIQSQQMMSGGGGSLIGSLLSGLGSVFGGGGGDIPGLASGGPMAAGSPAVVGEHGREIFVPSSPGRILSVPQSKAAVNGGGGTTVNQTINVTTGIQQTVRAEIQSLMPQIAAASTKAVLDARRRGGSFAGAFS